MHVIAWIATPKKKIDIYTHTQGGGFKIKKRNWPIELIFCIFKKEYQGQI